MAPFGKVHGAIHGAADRVKSGLAWANHKYQQGMHMAGKVNDLYQTGKKIASIFMPELNALGLDKPMMQGFGALDHMRDQGIQRHQDVLNRIQDNSAILDKFRQAQGMAQPYMS